MHTMVLQGDSVGSICQRHGISRQRLFYMNPLLEENSFITQDGHKTAQLWEGDTVRVYLDEAVVSQLRSVAMQAAQSEGQSGLDPQQQQVMNILADLIRDGKISDDLGKKVAEDVGRSGAMAACVYFTGNPSLSFACGEIGKKAGGTLWPLIKKGGGAVGSLVKKGGGYVLDKHVDAAKLAGKALKENFYGTPKKLVGHMGNYVKCVINKKSPYECAQETGVNLIEGAYNEVKGAGGKVVEFGKDAVCEVSGWFGGDWLCEDHSPPAPPPAPQLPPEPSLPAAKGIEVQYAADLITYLTQYANQLSEAKKEELTNQLSFVLGSSISLCSKNVFAKLDEATSKICQESVLTVVASAIHAILSDPSSADPAYALELAKAAKFGIAMEAVPYVNRAGVDAVTRIQVLLLLSSKNNGSMSPDVGLALFYTLIANIFGFSCDNGQECFSEFGVNDAVPMIWVGMLSNVNNGTMSPQEAAREAMRLFMSLLAENMNTSQSTRIAQELVASNEVPADVVTEGLANGYTSKCGSAPNCREESEKMAQDIVANADSAVSSSEEKKSGMSGWAIAGITVAALVGVGAAVRVSNDLPILPEDWSHPLS